MEDLTATNTGLLLQIAANYGGRWDMIQAARTVAERASTGEISTVEINEKMLSDAMAFGVDALDPDLLIRTGGEHRVSNFMLWQSAYAEFYFTDLLWPDFDAHAFDQALADFSNRQRRFGHTGAQLDNITLGASH